MARNGRLQIYIRVFPLEESPGILSYLWWSKDERSYYLEESHGKKGVTMLKKM